MRSSSQIRPVIFKARLLLNFRGDAVRLYQEFEIQPSQRVTVNSIFWRRVPASIYNATRDARQYDPISHLNPRYH
ncbi:MAG TPA: hypothetical protein VJH03_23545 [Blastocatellia bacterium]|nr:hypothetical protein [Blastocatellia bacterium]